MTFTIFISAPRHKLHLYLPVWPDHKLRGHADWLVVVLQPELLQQLDHDDVDLELREPPADAHARPEAERQGSERMRRVVSWTAAEPSLGPEEVLLGLPVEPARPLKKVLFDTTEFSGAQNLTQERRDSRQNLYDKRSKEQCFNAICEHITAVQ